jgi:hypothetical protein
MQGLATAPAPPNTCSPNGCSIALPCYPLVTCRKLQRIVTESLPRFIVNRLDTPIPHRQQWAHTARKGGIAMTKACSKERHYACEADEASLAKMGYPSDFIVNVKCDCNCHN